MGQPGHPGYARLYADGQVLIDERLGQAREDGDVSIVRPFAHPDEAELEEYDMFQAPESHGPGFNYQWWHENYAPSGVMFIRSREEVTYPWVLPEEVPQQERISGFALTTSSLEEALGEGSYVFSSGATVSWKKLSCHRDDFVIPTAGEFFLC